ncbi:MAG: fumarylacetoacetate hydrolase family protein [Proteobacteria bacterium]|nr:fumarylacetoacetate hydrolase family protein [Pseudomonadota bacterium]
MSAAERDLARLLAGLRRDARQQSGLDPALVPVDRDAAYRVAGLVAGELGLAVAGWKIAAAKAEMQRQLRTDAPIYGRVYAGHVRPSPVTVAHARQCSPIPEVEYMARLGIDLPPRAAPYTLEEVDAAVASLHPGIELAECRFVHDDRFPPLAAVLADGAGGGTLCVGPAIEDWRTRDIAGQQVHLSCNGVVRRSGTAAEALDHPLVPLTWLANELSRTGVGMKAGQVISTGTLTGMLRPRAGETYVADFGPFGTVTATYA